MVFQGRFILIFAQYTFLFILKINQSPERFCDPHKPPDTTRFLPFHILRVHPGMFPVIQFSIHQRIGEVTDCRICRDALPLPASCSVGFFPRLRFMVLPFQTGNCLPQPLMEIITGDRMAGSGFLIAVHPFIKYYLPQYHFRVVDKVTVHRDAIYIFFNEQPRAVFFIRYDFPFPFLQKQDIRCGFSSCHLLEGIVWQADCSDQFRPLRKVFPVRGVRLVHCVFRGDGGKDSTRSQLVQGFC